MLEKALFVETGKHSLDQKTRAASILSKRRTLADYLCYGLCVLIADLIQF